MRIWISGTIEQVINDSKTGLVDAIVTNPTVIAQWCENGKSVETLAAKVVSETNLPLYIQLRGPSVTDYLKQCDDLKKISDKIIPKIPSTIEGIQVSKILESRGLKTLVTTVCSISQAYACAAANISAICPYYNRLQENGESADDFLKETSKVYKNNGVKTKIIPASIRTLSDVQNALKSGSHGVIVFSKLFRELFQHKVTSDSLDAFEKDWEKVIW